MFAFPTPDCRCCAVRTRWSLLNSVMSGSSKLKDVSDASPIHCDQLPGYKLCVSRFLRFNPTDHFRCRCQEQQPLVHCNTGHASAVQTGQGERQRACSAQESSLCAVVLLALLTRTHGAQFIPPACHIMESGCNPSSCVNTLLQND